MAFNQFDLSELLDAVRAGGDIDLIRTSVEMVLQALVDAVRAGPVDPHNQDRALRHRTSRDPGRTHAQRPPRGSRQARAPCRIHRHHRPRPPRLRRRRATGGVAKQRQRRGRSGAQRRVGHTSSAARPRPPLGLIPGTRVGGGT